MCAHVYDVHVCAGMLVHVSEVSVHVQGCMCVCMWQGCPHAYRGACVCIRGAHMCPLAGVQQPSAVLGVPLPGPGSCVAWGPVAWLSLAAVCPHAPVRAEGILENARKGPA